jgi:CHAT domain-containing protein
MGEGLARQRLAALGSFIADNTNKALHLFEWAAAVGGGGYTAVSCNGHRASSLLALADLGEKPDQHYREAFFLCEQELKIPSNPVDCAMLLITQSEATSGMGKLGVDSLESFRYSLLLLHRASKLLTKCSRKTSYEFGICLLRKASCLQSLAIFDQSKKAKAVTKLRRAYKLLRCAKTCLVKGSYSYGLCELNLGKIAQELARLNFNSKNLVRTSIDYYKNAGECFLFCSPNYGDALLNEASAWADLATIGVNVIPHIEASYYIHAYSKYSAGLKYLEPKSMALAEYTQKMAMVLMKLAGYTNVSPSGIWAYKKFFEGKTPNCFLNKAHQLMCETVMPILEKIAGCLHLEAERRAFRETRKTSYQLITALCLDMARAECNPEQAEALRWEAWKWVQRGKARTLQESLENLRLNVQPLRPEQAAEFDALMEQFRSYDQSQPNPDGGRSQDEAAADHEPGWHQRVATLLASLVTIPKVATAKPERAPEPGRAIRNLDEQHLTVVIEFFASTEGKIGAFLHPAGAGSPLGEPVWLDASEADITALGQRQLAAIDVLRRNPRLRVREGRLQHDQGPNNEQVGQAKNEMLSIATRLGELLAPVRARIDKQGWKDEHLLLCPTGALHLLPLAAADWDNDVNGRTRPWIAAHPLVHLPTVKLASDVLARVQSDNSDESTSKHAYIAATDPWDRLGQIYTEAEHAKKVLECKSYTVNYFLREKAKLSTLRNIGASARVVHLAMHSGMHPRYFDYCGVEFYDTRLTVLELLLRLRLMKAQLAIVATCSSNQPRELLADDPSAITRAWMVSGAASVIGSLWPLADEPAMQFSRYFYQAWAGDETKREDPLPAIRALQQAILKVREENPDDLYAWAPYTLLGHGGTMM